MDLRDSSSAVLHQVTALTVRHVALLVTIVFAVYLTRVYDTLELQPRWRKDLDPEFYRNGRYPEKTTEKLPAPIIVDLDSDGLNEIVVITNTLHLEVLTATAPMPTRISLPHFNVVASTSLASSAGGSTGLPVAMAAGYVHPPNSTHPQNKVVVLLLSDWTVLCYDHALRLLWRRSVWEGGGSLTAVEMAVAVDAVRVDRRDGGTVVVTGSYRNDTDREKIGNLGGSQSHGHKFPHPSHDPTRLATFALGGTTGEVRWRHLPDDLKNSEDKKDFPVHHWKLEIKRGQIGESHWSDYSKVIFNQMPHRWQERGDSEVSFVSLRQGGTGNAPHTPQNSPRPLNSAPPLPAQVHQVAPADADGIVIRGERDLIVLNLHSGKPLTRLRFTTSFSSHVDLDSDGQLDAVRVSRCVASASNMHGEQRLLWEGHICSGATWWTWMQSAADDFNNEGSQIELPPVVVKRLSDSGRLARHLLAISDGESDGYDSVFATSAGYVTSYGPKGQLNWQVRVPASWALRTETIPGETPIDPEQRNVFLHSFTPSTVVTATHVDNKRRCLLVLGWEEMTLVDLTDGHQLASHSLPCHPIASPVTGDIDGDGFINIIVHCPEGYVAFTTFSGRHYVYTASVSASVVLLVLALGYCFKVT